ncbi:MAG TPA: ABC transporter substrate-binding protein, partial [Exilispira sp.]|nr:ABC transporter substrate-binding protein [Exilispira sp.]
MKKILPVLIILLAVFFLFGQANPGDTNGITPNEIKVGSFQALSGPLASMGISVKKGMDSYFNWINSNGGIYGRKINLIVSDDAFNPSNTVIEVKKLVESDKVFALMCGLGAPGNLAIMDYV